MKNIIIIILLSKALLSSSVKEFSLNNFSDFQKGKLFGIQITQKGLTSGIQIDPFDLIQEEVITSASEDSGNLILGSASGKVYKFKEKLEEIGKIGEGVITSVLSFKGKVYAGTSNPANLYLIDGEIKKIFSFDEKTIFVLLEKDGKILAGTGEGGNVYIIDGEKKEEILKTKQEGISSIIKGKSGNLYIGTFGKGIIYKIKNGKSEALFSSNYYQVSDLCEDKKGNLYFLLSSFPRVDEKEKKSILASAIGVYENGVFRILKEFPDRQIATLYYFDYLDMLIYGGSDGKLYSFKDGKEGLLSEFSQKKVSFVLNDFIITAESSQIFKYRVAEKGYYLSEVFDPKREARWGKLYWSGKGNISIYARFGPTSEPDDFWTPFTEPCKEKICNFDKNSNFAQIKVELSKEAILENFFWLAKPKNLPPEIKSFKVSKPGEVFLKSSGQENIIAEATNPDRYGIFTTVDYPPPEGKDKGLKKAYKKGFITLSWDVSEPDGEEVDYSLFFRPEGGEEWFEIFKEEKITFFSFDTTALPDGYYKFKLIAKDLPERESTEEISVQTFIDNTPPVISSKVEKDYFFIKVKDTSRLIKAEYSCNAKVWQKIDPEDKILDGEEENFKIKIDEKCSFVVLRFMDSFYNLSTISIK